MHQPLLQPEQIIKLAQNLKKDIKKDCDDEDKVVVFFV